MSDHSPEPSDSRPMLLVLTSTYPRWAGDPEPGFVHELAKRLTGRFRVIVLGPHASGAARHEVLDGVEVIRYRYAPERLETLVNDGGIVTNLRQSKWKMLLVPGFVLIQAWWAWRLIRTRQIDVIHAHWLIPQGLIAALLQLPLGRRMPFVATSHGADVYALKGSVLNTLKRFVVRQSSAATVVSSAMKENLRSIGADIARVSVLPMGVDASGRFTPDVSVMRSADEILFVGRLVEKKGIPYLIHALPEVLRRHPSAKLTIAGFGPDEQNLRAQVEKSGLSDHVQFLGAVPQSQLPALYRRAAVFVAPFVKAATGDQEGLPVALMEAVACGCPVIAGDVPGIDDLLGDLKTETCVNPRDVSSLAHAIAMTLSDTEGARARAVRIREIAVSQVSWNTIADNYAHLLENLCPQN